MNLTNLKELSPLVPAKQFLKASRFQVTPVMIIPVLVGSVGAYAWNQEFHWHWFAVTMLGAVALHLFSNMINDLWDYRQGTDQAALVHSESVSTHSGVLTGGKLSEQTFARLTWALLSLAIICGLILIYYRGFGVLVYGGIGTLLAYFYVAPPIKYGYRGKGYSELSIFICFGLLPVLGSYYVQTVSFDYRAMLASFPIGALTSLILFNHHFLHWQTDKAAGKKTLVVMIGEMRALRVSLALFGTAYLFLLLAIVLGAIPVYALLGLLTAPPLMKVYRTLLGGGGHLSSHAYLPLMKASLAASIRCGLIITLSLSIQGMLS